MMVLTVQQDNIALRSGRYYQNFPQDPREARAGFSRTTSTTSSSQVSCVFHFKSYRELPNTWDSIIPKRTIAVLIINPGV